jgi:hypothetical protein
VSFSRKGLPFAPTLFMGQRWYFPGSVHWLPDKAVRPDKDITHVHTLFIKQLESVLHSLTARVYQANNYITQTINHLDIPCIYRANTGTILNRQKPSHHTHTENHSEASRIPYTHPPHTISFIVPCLQIHRFLLSVPDIFHNSFCWHSYRLWCQHTHTHTHTHTLTSAHTHTHSRTHTLTHASHQCLLSTHNKP